MPSAHNGDVELAFDVEGAGPDLLLIAGTASTRALWALVRPELAKSFRTIAFDNRDSGESSIVSASYSLGDLAADALGVLDAADSERAHVLGHSLGGAIAQVLALSSTQRCLSLTLACSWARGNQYSRNGVGLMKALAASVADDRTLLAAILWAGAGATTLRDADLWEWSDAALALGPLAPREALIRQWEIDLGVDVLDRLAQLRLPAHVIWCSEDRFLPQPLSQELRDAIPGAVETRIDRCGHLPMVHVPDAFCDAVLGFLVTLRQAAGDTK
jgi:pimeloyl-ACP methyl ester carboxylesterase